MVRLSHRGNLWLADTLWKLGAIEFGDFTLAHTAGHSAVPLHLPCHRAKRSQIEGLFDPGQTVLIIDDLMTGGHSIVETAARLEKAGLQVRDAIVLVDRQQGGRQRLKRHGINLISVLPLEVVLNYLMSSGKISEEWYRRSLDYLKASRRS